MTDELWLGIDPGAATGWALIQGGRIVAIDTIRERGEQRRFRIRELSDVAKNMHGCRHAAVQVIAVEGKSAPRFYPGSGMALVRNAALSGWIVGCLEALGFTVVQVPSASMRRSGMKMARKTWALAWSYTGKTSEHARDAAQIAWWAMKHVMLEPSK